MTTAAPPRSNGPYDRHAHLYLERGYSVIPIAPGTKRPGQYAGGEWRGMTDWERYSDRYPTDMETVSRDQSAHANIMHWHGDPDYTQGRKNGGVPTTHIDTRGGKK